MKKIFVAVVFGAAGVIIIVAVIAGIGQVAGVKYNPVVPWSLFRASAAWLWQKYYSHGVWSAIAVGVGIALIYVFVCDRLHRRPCQTWRS